MNILAWLRSSIGMVIAGLVVLVLILGVLQVRSWQQDRLRAAQSKIDRGQAGAARESAADAVNTVGNVAEAQRESEDLTRSNEREIRDAEGANDAVNPAVRDAGLRSLCRRAASRNDPRCRVQPTPAR